MNFRRAAPLSLGWPGRIPRSASMRQPGGGRSLNLATPCLAPLESASARRTSMPGSLPTTLTTPSGLFQKRGIGGHPCVVAGWRDRDVKASRRRSARSQGRRRAVKQGCPPVARPRHRAGRQRWVIGCRCRDYLESASDSVAPEHLRGSWQPGSMTLRRIASVPRMGCHTKST